MEDVEFQQQSLEFSTEAQMQQALKIRSKIGVFYNSQRGFQNQLKTEKQKLAVLTSQQAKFKDSSVSNHISALKQLKDQSERL